ncbi:MAG: AAA family ATPase [Candidatus Neptunochlamydia sp.]|nr:AAA family ATPase [Candidatus Neptunochlamydia sp.]
MELLEIDELVVKRCGPIGGELMLAAREGHLCLQKDKIIEGCVELKGGEERFEGLVGRWGDLYYLQRNWVLEGEVVRNFVRLMRDVKWIDTEEKGSLNEGQYRAVQLGLSEGVTCLTGGPGTGKSYVIGEIVRSFGGSVCVCAPTGKAVSLLREKLDCEIGTLHGILGIKGGKDLLFSAKPLNYEMVIVDECSMIDVGLWAALLRNIKNGTRLILVGDHDQLPPVEAGTIFGELCRYMREKKKGYVHLNECMRSDSNEILGMAEAVKNGAMIEYGKLERRLEDWKKEFKKGGFRILSCLRKGVFGVEAINELMWGEEEIPIMINRTDKRMGLSNGEMGVLLKKNEGHSLGKDDIAVFGDREFPAVLLPEFELAYCLSVHKSQGSEFERVVLLVPKGSEIFGREILYTGITRAKEAIEVLADEGVVEKCLEGSAVKMSGTWRRLCEH